MESQYNAPENMKSLINMASSNEIIQIYEGDFELRNPLAIITLTGSITFKWFPEMRPEFSGKQLISNNEQLTPIDLLSQNGSCELLINGLLFGKCYVTKVQTNSSSTHAIVKGIFPSNCHLNDTSVAVSSIKFNIANLRKFNGSVTILENNGIHTYSNNRLTFTTTGYTITLDKIDEFDEAHSALQEEGGYRILYTGEITHTRNSIKLADTESLIHCFSTFISFLNGRRCSLLFLSGMFEGEIIWQDFTPRFTDQYTHVPSWPSLQGLDGLNESWQYFHSLWQTEVHKDFITSAVHWYVEVNSHVAFTEGSIVLTQTALELLYNWLIIEQKGLLLGKDAENISAANKIRLLINTLGLTYEVPMSLTELKKFESANQDTVDGPDAFVQIRNAIVHSQEEKRKKLMLIPNRVMYESLKLGIWYLELALLYSFKFKGKYRNRCSTSKWAGSDEDYVPWAIN